MKSYNSNLLFWLMYFIIAILIAWITLSLVLLWAKPQLYNSDGSVNWATTLWIATLVVLFAWLIVWLIRWIIGWVWRRCNPCEEGGWNY